MRVTAVALASNGCAGSATDSLLVPASLPRPGLTVTAPADGQTVFGTAFPLSWEAAHASSFRVSAGAMGSPATSYSLFPASSGSTASPWANTGDSAWVTVTAYNDCGDSALSTPVNIARADIAGSLPLAFWFRADSLHLSAGGVDTLRDISGKGLHLLQPTAAQRPALLPAVTAINGRPAIWLGGAQRLSSTLPATFQELWVVFSWGGAAKFPAYNGLFNGAAAGASSNLFCGTPGSASLYSEAASFAGNTWVNGIKTLAVNTAGGYQVARGTAATPKSLASVQLGDLRSKIGRAHV